MNIFLSGKCEYQCLIDFWKTSFKLLIICLFIEVNESNLKNYFHLFKEKKGWKTNFFCKEKSWTSGAFLNCIEKFVMGSDVKPKYEANENTNIYNETWIVFKS
jgi:hypothetical protein